MRILAAVGLSLILCSGAVAQEYGHDSAAATLDMTTKRSTNLFSGSLSMTSMHGFGATVGGTAVKDHIWFFASADHSNALIQTPAAPQPAVHFAPSTAGAPAPALSLPKGFLSLHSTTQHIW